MGNRQSGNLKSSMKTSRFRYYTTFLGWAILAMLLMSPVAERLLFVNATWYPGFLVNEDLGDGFSKDWFLLQRQQCGEPLEIYDKGFGKSIIRCGLVWPFTTTWAVDTMTLQRVGM